MNRKEFFKRLGLGMLVAPVAVKVVGEIDLSSRLPIPQDIESIYNGFEIHRKTYSLVSGDRRVYFNPNAEILRTTEGQLSECKHKEVPWMGESAKNNKI